ncbi:MAG: SH3 domain-containing protein [Caldilineaceae bacterium]
MQVDGVDAPAWISSQVAEVIEMTPVPAAETAADAAAVLLPTPTPGDEATPAAKLPVSAPDVPTAFTQPDRMNVRAGPGTGYPVVATVAQGTALEILALGPTGEWYQVTLPDREEPAFVFAGLTTPRARWTTCPDWRTMTCRRHLNPRRWWPRRPHPSTRRPRPAAASSATACRRTCWAAASTARSARPPIWASTGSSSRWSGATSKAARAQLTSANCAAWWTPPAGWDQRAFQRGQRRTGREPGFDSSVGGPPADPQSYAAFVGRLAGEFCGSGLKAIEVWNEQNLHYEWGNKPLNPADYMNLLRAAYGSIKGACPSMLVISGALTPAGDAGPYARDDFAYLEGMYQNGWPATPTASAFTPAATTCRPAWAGREACAVIQQTGNFFNGPCDTPHHSWSFRSTMEGYRNIMVVYGDANKRLWPTEFGWAVGPAVNGAYAYANDNSADEQAAWTVEAFQMMRSWGWVGPAFLWNLNFRVVADGTEKAQWGIVRNDYSPLPVYEALRAMPK